MTASGPVDSQARAQSVNLAPRAGLPRWFEALTSALALILLSPLLLLIAVVVRATSQGPALFRQIRVGRAGSTFELLKFRSMTEPSPSSPGSDSESQSSSLVTASHDQRITAIGRMLRASKLDELPELLNVAKGDMSLVGPRPEVPKFVDLESRDWQNLLSVRPGLTNETTLLLRNEEALLALGAEHCSTSPETFYTQYLLPFKLQHSIRAASARTWRSDLAVLLRTAGAIVGLGRRPSAEQILDQLLEATTLADPPKDSENPGDNKP